MSSEGSKNTIFLGMKQLEAEGICREDLHTALQLECFDNVFSRVSVLAKRYQEKAISICEEYLNSGFDTFITDSESFLSVWKSNRSFTERHSATGSKVKIFILKQDEIRKSNDLSEKEVEKPVDILTPLFDDSYDLPEVKKRLISSVSKEPRDSLGEKLPLENPRDQTNSRKENWWQSYIS